MLVSEVYIFKYRLSAEGWTLADGYLLPFIWGEDSTLARFTDWLLCRGAVPLL